MVVLQFLGCFFALLCLARLTFVLLFVVPAFICLNNGTSTETCGDSILAQDVKNKLNMAGTFVETGTSFLVTSLIFSWGRFHTANFFRAAPRTAIFWFWMSLFSVEAITRINMDIVPGQWVVLGVSIIFEMGTLVVLCLALKFIKKSTVKAWVDRSASSQPWASFLYFVYIFTLWVYMMRNLSLVFYDMGLLSMHIERHPSLKQIDSLLLIANIANRASFAQFFYATIFRNPKLSVVCDNVEQTQVGHVGVPDSKGGVQPVVAWEPSMT